MMPLSISTYPAQPIDSVMQLLGADDAACHVLIELNAPINSVDISRACTESELLQTLNRLRFVRGGWGREPHWNGDASGQLHTISVNFDGAFEAFNPDIDLPPLLTLGRFTVIHRAAGLCWMVFSWSHVMFDARGAEYVLKHILGDSASQSFSQSKKIIREHRNRRHMREIFKERRSMPCKDKVAVSKRQFLTLPAEDLWGEKCKIFFRSAALVAAAMHSLSESSSLLFALPVISERNRTFPGNQLKMTHLLIKRGATIGETYEAAVEALEYANRERLPETCNDLLRQMSKLGSTTLRRMIKYPAKGRFADMCVSSLGQSTIRVELRGMQVQRVRHYPPLLNSGAPTIVYYEFEDTATLIAVGSGTEDLKSIATNIRAIS